MTSRVRQKVETFSKILQDIAQLSTASTLKVGAMSLHWQFQKIASFGYNGSYSGANTNPETGTEEDSLIPGQSGFIHAEVNMIAKFREHNPEDYIILLTHSPCNVCSKVLVNAGFKYIYWIKEYRETIHLNIFKDRGIKHGDIEQLIHDYPYIVKRKEVVNNFLP
jgi:dCMP deaminase